MSEKRAWFTTRSTVSSTLSSLAIKSVYTVSDALTAFDDASNKEENE